jgi:hypothetical protein
MGIQQLSGDLQERLKHRLKRMNTSQRSRLSRDQSVYWLYEFLAEPSSILYYIHSLLHIYVM